MLNVILIVLVLFVLYRLRDSSPKVRQNTLTILTHLILNDMVKVKGQISDIALCMNDDDPRISGEFARYLIIIKVVHLCT